MRSYVHVHGAGRRPQQVVVERGDGESALQKAGHHGVHFLVREHKIAHYHHVVAHRLKRGPGAERQRRLYRDAIQDNAQVGARKSVATNSVGLLDADAPQRGVNLRPFRCRPSRRG